MDRWDVKIINNRKPDIEQEDVCHNLSDVYGSYKSKWYLIDKVYTYINYII
ncbi:MAG: hypothetical protein AAGU14_04910 [Eubacteriaceae bacterium]